MEDILEIKGDITGVSSGTGVFINGEKLPGITRIEYVVEGGKLSKAALYVSPVYLNARVRTYKVVSEMAEMLAARIAKRIGAQGFEQIILEEILEFGGKTND